MAWNPTKLASAAPRSPIILAQSGVASSVTGTTAETTLASITIPGGMMGVNGAVRVSMMLSFTGSTNSKTMRMAFGGVTQISVSTSTAANTTFAQQITICNRGSLTSQISQNWAAGMSPATLISSNVNTAADQTIAILGTLASAAESITLASYTVEVLPS